MFQDTEEIKNKFKEENKANIRRKAEKGQSKYANIPTNQPNTRKTQNTELYKPS